MICVSFGTIRYPQLLRQLKNESLVEVRIDLNNYTGNEISEIFSSPTRTIATCRPGALTEEKRIDNLKLSIRSGAAYVDMESDSDERSLKEISALCMEYNCTLIISYHNGKGTPSSSELKSIYKLCSEKGADIVKIACRVLSEKDNAVIMALYDTVINSEGVSLISIGMGETGRITRVAAPLLGAPFTYASAGEGRETAEGQMDSSTLKIIYKLIKNGK